MYSILTVLGLYMLLHSASFLCLQKCLWHVVITTYYSFVVRIVIRRYNVNTRMLSDAYFTWACRKLMGVASTVGNALGISSEI
jgi:hypothetical protein